MSWRTNLEDAIWRALEEGVSRDEIEIQVKEAIEDYGEEDE
jgi:hypothetical protein